MLSKKHIKVPKTHDPGLGRPKEHLAYINRAEAELLRQLTDGTVEKGPKGIPSYASFAGTSGTGYASGYKGSSAPASRPAASRSSVSGVGSAARSGSSAMSSAARSAPSVSRGGSVGGSTGGGFANTSSGGARDSGQAASRSAPASRGVGATAASAASKAQSSAAKSVPAAQGARSPSAASPAPSKSLGVGTTSRGPNAAAAAAANRLASIPAPAAPSVPSTRPPGSAMAATKDSQQRAASAVAAPVRPSGTSTQFGGAAFGPGSIYSNPSRSAAALNSVLNNTRLAGMDNRQTIDAVSRNMGLSNPLGRAGMIGTFDHESAGLDPNALGDKGTAFGLGQWRNDRRQALNSYAARMGLPKNDAGLQTAFAISEMSRAYPGTLTGLQQARTIPEAVAAMNDFERPRGWTPGGAPSNVAGWNDRVARSNRALNAETGTIVADAQPAASASIPITYQKQPGRVSNPSAEGLSSGVLSKWQQTLDAFGKPVPIVSAYRSPATNALAGGAKKSQHMTGNAIDVDVSALSIPERQALISEARRAGFTGVGVYNNALHFDTGPERVWGPSRSNASVPGWAKEALSTKPTGGFQTAAATTPAQPAGPVPRPVPRPWTAPPKPNPRPWGEAPIPRARPEVQGPPRPLAGDPRVSMAPGSYPARAVPVPTARPPVQGPPRPMSGDPRVSMPPGSYPAAERMDSQVMTDPRAAMPPGRYPAAPPVKDRSRVPAVSIAMTDPRVNLPPGSYPAAAAPARGLPLRGIDGLTGLPPGYAERYGLGPKPAAPAAPPAEAPATRGWLEAAKDGIGGFQQAAEKKIEETKQAIKEVEEKYGPITEEKVKLALWWNGLTGGGGSNRKADPRDPGSTRDANQRRSRPKRRIALPASSPAAQAPAPEAQPDMSYFTNVVSREEALRRLLGEGWYA